MRLPTFTTTQLGNINLGLTAIGAALFLYLANDTSAALFYWAAAASACIFFFVLGAEWQRRVWQPLAEDVLDMLGKILEKVKRCR